MLGEYTLISRVACWKIPHSSHVWWSQPLSQVPWWLAIFIKFENIWINTWIHRNIDKDVMAKPGCSKPNHKPTIGHGFCQRFLGIFRQVYDWVYRFIGIPELPKPKQSPLVRQSVVASNVQGRTSQLTRWKVTDAENKVYHPNVHFEWIVRI